MPLNRSLGPFLTLRLRLGSLDCVPGLRRHRASDGRELLPSGRLRAFCLLAARPLIV